MDFDVVVIGAGHAGVEAALASARMGLNTLMLTLNLDSIGLMPCNPAIGGTGKGHLVRELDAMGGEMGLAADDTLIQMRMLNTGKGPAVHSLRAQMDKRRYHERIKKALESQQRLTIVQGEAIRINQKGGRVCSVQTDEGFSYNCRAVVMASGVYLKSRILIGDYSRQSGPCGMMNANYLSQSLIDLGLPLQRFKTGTPARVKRSSLDLGKMDIQLGDVPTPAFSFLNGRLNLNQQPCYLTYTNANTHRIILDNLYRSPMYSGRIEATGTRYCPSIEDKIVRFADKDRHQIFIEPEGLTTQEMYVQGMSTSLPADVQIKMLRTLRGMENCQVMRLGYAIEYDCLQPTCLNTLLMAKGVEGLFTAGQVNGSSGYEEAAAQGFYAGVNAALYVKCEQPFELSRADAYIGVLVDDLAIKGTPEPYRMMTSRCEYRLLLRQDNADIRLTERARRLGLITEQRWRRLNEKREQIERALKALDASVAPTDALKEYLNSIGESSPKTGVKLFELLKRPQVRYTELESLFNCLPQLDYEAQEQVEIIANYDGYIEKQKDQLEKLKSMQNTPLPTDLDYSTLQGLRLEARQKCNATRPRSIAEAARISGVSPSDVAVLMIYAKKGFKLDPKEEE